MKKQGEDIAELAKMFEMLRDDLDQMKMRQNTTDEFYRGLNTADNLDENEDMDPVIIQM